MGDVITKCPVPVEGDEFFPKMPCGKEIKSRERRPDGIHTCTKGHRFKPSQYPETREKPEAVMPFLNDQCLHCGKTFGYAPCGSETHERVRQHWLPRPAPANAARRPQASAQSAPEPREGARLALALDPEFGAVSAEYLRAKERHGEHCIDGSAYDTNEQRLAVLMEEVGKVAHSLTYDSGEGQDDLYKELIQVATMALGFAKAVREKSS